MRAVRGFGCFKLRVNFLANSIEDVSKYPKNEEETMGFLLISTKKHEEGIRKRWGKNVGQNIYPHSK